MRSVWSRLAGLSWKWRLLLLLLMIILIVVVLVPAVTYLLRARDVPDYSEIVPQATMTYLVSYDSGDGLVNDSEWTLIVAETGVTKGSEFCIHIVTVIDPYPERKVNAIIVGSAKAKVGTIELWYSQDDLRILYGQNMLVNAPIVNTLVTRATYSGYDGYPGRPYSLGDSWTYEVFCDPDTFLQADWTDSYHAEVVADDEIVKVGDTEYECFKVVHTLVDTTIGIPSGAGVGSTFVEFWPKDSRSIVSLKVEDYLHYVGVETRILIDADPMPSL